MFSNNPCTKLYDLLFASPVSLVEEKKELSDPSIPANLDEYPEKFVNNGKKHFTIGDLHGNSLKMLYFLIKANLIDISPQDYNQLRDAYHQVENGNINAIFDFEKILRQSGQSPKKMNKHIKIRFLGDLLADRGANDYLTFLVLKLIHQAKYEIIFSNHDLEYLTHSESENLNKEIEGYISPVFLNSLINLKKFLCSQKVINTEYIHALENLYYKPYLKLLSYTLPENTNHIHIYSHALIDLKTIENIAIQFKIDISQIKESRKNLCQIVDAINENFQKAVLNRETHKLFDLISSRAGNGNVSYDYPLEQTVWNRQLTASEVEKHNKAAYEIEFYHGHTEKTALPHYHGYDNTLGKGKHNEVGTIDVYRSDNPSSITSIRMS